MRLTVLGCSGSGPGPTSPASGYLVEAGDAHIVMDLGNGTFGAMQRHLDPWQLDGILFSHLHPDHCADFSALTVHRRYHPFRPYEATERRLPVHAPAEAPQRFANAYAASAAELAETDLNDVYDFRPLTDGTTAQLAGTTIHTRRVDHLCEAYGLRIEHAGRSIVYSGDTGACPELIELATGADVFLCEATWPHQTRFYDEPPPGVHLSGRQAGEHATAAGVGKLLLTHIAAWFNPDDILAEAKAAFDGPIELVRADQAYDV